MSHVGYGDGTITRRKDGRLQVTVSVNGRRQYVLIPKMADRRSQRAAAQRELDRLRDQRAAGVDPGGQTLAVFLRSWLDGLRDGRRVRPRTLDHYELIAEQHIIPTLGHHKLDRLTERHVQAWLDADRAAPRTVHHHRAVLRRALNVALRQRAITRNPALAVELPDPGRFHGSPLTVDEARALLAATAGDRLGALWRLAIDTGLRQGELLGLAKDDVNLDAGTVTCRMQLQRRDGTWGLVPTKANRSLDELSIGPSTVAALRAHLLRQASERRPDWKYHGLLFVTPDGQPFHGAAILRAFHDACDLAGIPRRRFHDLRGSSATLMAEAGVAEDVRMARLGHNTQEMARHYARIRGPRDRDAADRLDASLG